MFPTLPEEKYGLNLSRLEIQSGFFIFCAVGWPHPTEISELKRQEIPPMAGLTMQ